MKKRVALDGVWNGQAEGLGTFRAELPGTLDTNQIGIPDKENLASRLTRLYTYEGKVRFFKQIKIPEPERGHLFLKIERTKELTLEIDSVRQEAFEAGTLSTPWIYDLTPYGGKQVEIALIVDNQYTGWPRESMIGASAVTDETQTNWNGILGDFAIYKETEQFFDKLRIYPSDKEIKIKGVIVGIEPEQAVKERLCIRLKSKAIKEEEIVLEPEQWIDVSLNRKGRCGLDICHIRLSETSRKWDEGEGNIYRLDVQLQHGQEKNRKIMAETSDTFGIRTFSVDSGQRLTLNGRRFFLRGEANCCVFPETGYPPMTEEEWKTLLEIYASYGVNCMRFHSWCPPEAAFYAADKMGMMMQPELSQWNFKDAFKDDKTRSYYRKEMFDVLKYLSNHPSFVMMTFGNELLYTEEGYQFAEELLNEARQYDPTRLYANSSNYHYGEEGIDPGSDFYTAMALQKEMLRATSSPMIGHLNHEYPSACHSYEKAVDQIRKAGKPVFGFEVGQYEVLPEFSEIAEFRGVTRAVNLEIIRDNVERQGRLKDWRKYVEATGEMALLCYREETEAVLRTEGMSGLSLLGLQDFPGQGTALVGMLNSHLKTKPYDFAQPERFRKFFAPVVPMLYLPKYTYVNGERLMADCHLANYGKNRILSEAGWRLLQNGKMEASGRFTDQEYEPGGLYLMGKVDIVLPVLKKSEKLSLEVYIGDYVNEYPIWVFTGENAVVPDRVKVADVLTPDLVDIIENGATVFLEPEPSPENFPSSVRGNFTTDFWSVGTFPEQEGTMGMVIDKGHPALSDFPTESYCNYQWWIMSMGRPMILPDHINPIVTVPDCYSKLRHLGLLFEAELGRGKIMVSSMGLHNKQEYPECRGLLKSLLDYLEKVETDFERPGQSITREELSQLINIAEKQE